MICPNCSTDNPESHKFCGECGCSLPVVCQMCGFENRASSKFCGGCGVSLAGPEKVGAHHEDHSGQRVSFGDEAERRQLTVMFCDLVDSTALSAGMDPEELRDVLRRYHEVAVAEIDAQDGFIARYMGDGLLVYFGYPQAHENDAERAIRAGLGIANAIGGMKLDDGNPLSVRVGIATGQVVVGDIIGKGAAEERAVLGDTPNLAARLQGIAEPGDVVISDTTRELAERFFDFQDLGSHTLKGIPEDVPAFSVTGEQSLLDRSIVAAKSKILPMVGRETELETVMLQWSAVCRGDAKAVWIEADAGMGKSRLVRAITDGTTSQDHAELLFYCSNAYASSPYFALIERLRGFCRIKAEQSVEETIACLSSYLDDKNHHGVIVHLLHGETPENTFQLPDDSTAARNLLSAALRALLTKLAETRPVLVVIEDFQWADPSTRELFNTLWRGDGIARSLFLVATRPTGVDKPTLSTTTVSLTQIGNNAAQEIIHQILGDMDLNETGLVDRIVDQAGGSPLYLEELGKTVRQTVSAGSIASVGDAVSVIPTTLHDALMARLDGLGDDKAFAQAASVVGRTFSAQALAVTSGVAVQDLRDVLERLTETEILEAIDTTQNIYMFHHVLMQEVAYQSILKSTRVRLHGLLAEAFSNALASQVFEHPEVVAHHYFEAGDKDNASVYWERGGKRAAARMAHQEAIEFFDKSIDALIACSDLEDSDHREMVLRMEIVKSMRIVDRPDDALTHLDRAQAIAREVGALLERAGLHTLRGGILFSVGDRDGSREENEAALALAREAADPEMEARALSGLSDYCFLDGNPKLGVEYASQCIQIAEGAGLVDIVSANLGMRGHQNFYLNNFDQALSDCCAAVEQTTALGNKRAEMIARGSCYAKVLYDLNEIENSAEQLQFGLDICEELGAGRFRPMYFGMLATIHGKLDDADNFRHFEDKTLASIDAISHRFVGGIGYGALACGAAYLGNLTNVQEYFTKGEEILRTQPPLHNVLWFYRFAIDASLEMHDWNEAKRFSRDLQAFAEDKYIPWADFVAEYGNAMAAVGERPEDGDARKALKDLSDRAKLLKHKNISSTVEKALS